MRRIILWDLFGTKTEGGGVGGGDANNKTSQFSPFFSATRYFQDAEGDGDDEAVQNVPVPQESSPNSAQTASYSPITTAIANNKKEKAKATEIASSSPSSSSSLKSKAKSKTKLKIKRASQWSVYLIVSSRLPKTYVGVTTNFSHRYGPLAPLNLVKNIGLIYLMNLCLKDNKDEPRWKFEEIMWPILLFWSVLKDLAAWGMFWSDTFALFLF